MNANEYVKIIAAKWPYMAMRYPKDAVYHDSVSEKQILAWRKEWLRGALFGWINPAPDYVQNSFDCDKEVSDFIAFCVRKNADTGKALPICRAVVQTHALFQFLDDGTIKFLDVRRGEVYGTDIERPLYLEQL